jgi:hypothetical protein
MVRVDTGEVLGTTLQRFGASAPDDPATPDNEGPVAAMEKTFEELMPRSADALTSGFLLQWQRTLLDIADFRLMVTNVSELELEGMFNLLKTFSPRVEAYTKAFYGDQAIINVFIPGVRSAELIEFLERSRVFQFSILPADERRIELQLL